MNFKELKDETHGFLVEIMHLRREKSSFWRFYHQLRDSHQQYFKEAKKKNLNSGQFQNVHQSFVNGVSAIVQNADLGHVFVSLNEYTKVLSDVAWKAPLLKTGAEGLVEELDELWGRLSELMRKPQQYPLILEILDRCEKIERRLLYFEHCERFLRDAGALLNEQEEAPENFGLMDLGFTVDIHALADLNFRLNSLQVIYAEACLIFDVNESEFPLTISKVESGSLWSRVFGESKVIGFVIWFLKGGIRYLHRTFTLEGKLARIPGDVEMLDKQLEIHRKLKEVLPEARYQALVAEQGGVLAKSCFLMAKHTQNLLEREIRLRVDSEVLELEHAAHEKYLRAAAKQLPEHTTFRVLQPESVEGPRKPTAKAKKQKAEKGQQETGSDQ